MRLLSNLRVRRDYCLIATLAIAIFFPAQSAFSKEVPLTEAKTIGATFLKHISNQSYQCDSLVLVEEFYSNIAGGVATDLADNIFIFAVHPSPGFIIVSTDDRVKPILAYSLKNEISPSDLPPDMQDWLRSYSDQIEAIVAEDLTAPQETINHWESLRNDTPYRTMKSGINVNPLIQTTWNQGRYYNDDCPYDESAEKLTYTGCVATTMAQILNYWEHPIVGQGSHTYTHATYGELTADFGATTYDWSSMPSSLSSSNTAVAELMFHSAISVDMNFGPNGSGAYSSYVLNAMPNYFKYSSDIDYVSRSSYTEVQWTDLLLGELTSGRPIYYTGRHSAGGHAFICDGYDGTLYHFNWGWGGYADGFFSINNLNPATKTYNDSQAIIYNIHPDGAIEQPILSIQPSTKSVDSPGGSVSFAVANTGTGTMNWTASVTGGSSWAAISSGDSGTNSGSINVDVDPNEGDSRTATILVVATGAIGSPKEITVVQDAAPGKPDFYINITEVNTPSLNPGDIFSAEIEKGNQGTEPSVPGLVKYILSRNSSISQDDITLEENRPDSWEAGYSQSYEFNDLRIPESIGTGEWYFIISLDTEDEIEEDNESNNIAAVQFTVNEPGKPDVFVSALTVLPEVVEPMAYIEGHFEIGNAGETEMPSSHYRYAISDDAAYSNDDYTVSYSELGILDAGSEDPNGSTGDFQLPESIVEGDWYLIVMLDCDTEIEEDNEDNNVAVAEFSVANTDLPDVFVNSLSIEPQLVEPMAFLEGHFVLGNSGAADMAQNHYRYAISSDATYSGNDYTISYSELEAMSAGSENQNGSTGDFQLPESIGVGDWYLIVMLDCDTEIEEEDEGNNSAVVEFTVAKPDLYVSFGTVYTPNPAPGDYISIDIEKGNQGGIASTQGLVKYILSSDNSVSGDDIVLEEGCPACSWDVGYSESLTFDDLRVPESIDQGVWYLIVSIDANSEITEISEDNNIAVAQFTVIEQEKPDLYITNLSTSPSVVAPLSYLEGHFELGNCGAADMPSSYCRFAISKDATYSGDDYTVSYDELGAMGAGTDNQNGSTGDFQLPESIGYGDWYFIVLLDCDTDVEEENEGNNCVSVKFTVASPDLYISFGTLYTPSPAPGEFFSIELEKGNQGGMASDPGFVRYILSKDNSISGDDIVLEEGRPGDSWAAGFNQSLTLNDLRIPESVEPGNWNFIVSLDANSEIAEVSEDNNIAVAQFTVVNQAMPDVYLANLSASPVVVEPMAIMEGFFEIGNAGAADMPSSHYRYAISSDVYYSGDDYTVSYGELNGMASGYVNGNASTGDFYLPESIGIGDWFLIAMVDCNTDIEEENENNNIATAEFTVASSDLFVNFQNVSTPSLLPGELFRAGVEFGNRGGLASMPGKIRYMLSRDQDVTTEDLVLMEGNSQTVWNAGYYQHYELNDFRIPEDTDDGQWFIIASVDTDEEIDEESEANNISTVSIIVSPTEPVLVLSEEDFDIDYQEGLAAFQIGNSGTGTLTWELSVIEGNEWLAIRNNETSGSGERTITFDFANNSGCDLRSAKILIQSNSSNGTSKEVVIEQESDPNNVADLAFDEIDVVLGGKEVSIDILINNSGCQAEGTEVEYFICDEASCESPISWLGSSICDPLANGQSISIHTNFNLDGIEDGTYFLATRIDPDEQVLENDKENNISYCEISINSTGIDNLFLENSLNIYPNPTSGWVNISLDVSSNSNGLMTIYDQMGRTVEKLVINELMAWEARIDTRKWDAGFYSIVLISGDQLVHRKLIVR